MSELINKNDNRAAIRWKLLTGASALALGAYISSAAMANAEDAGQPQLWIEFGGQLSRLQDGQETFAPLLMDARPSIFAPSQKLEGPPLYSIDGFAGLTFRPDNSDLVFSASVRYGRSAAKRHFGQQTNPQPFYKYYYNSLISGVYLHGTRHLVKLRADPAAQRFTETTAQNSERHAILDFQAGKDVGLGLFGGNRGSSVLGLGVRFAQFRSKSNIVLKSDPDWHFNYKYFPTLLSFGRTSSKVAWGQIYHSNSASLQAVRSFRGIGPSLSWSASAPFAGNLENGELSVDWGVNAALLFGRQRTKVHHQTTGRYHSGKYAQGLSITYQPTPVNKTRTRNVTVPNVGGSVGLTWQLQNFKASLGYRADFFFNAIDGGIDARKSENRAFYGPYASISIGLGD